MKNVVRLKKKGKKRGRKKEKKRKKKIPRGIVNRLRDSQKDGSC